MLTLAVTYAGVLGGAERTLADFASGLPGDVVLACPEGALAAHARARGLTVVPIRERPLERAGGLTTEARALADLAGHAREVRRLAEALRPDVLLAWGMRSAIAASAGRARLSPRPGLLIRHVDFLPPGRTGSLGRLAASRADAVSANSAAVAADLDPERRLGARLSVVSPGVELDAYEPAWRAGERPEALLLGALVPWKRPDLALEAVALAARAIPDLLLTVAGTSLGAGSEAYAERLRTRARRPDLAGHVVFAGALDDPREALARAWCLLHCADREPFGSVLVQAMASGRPVIAPASGGPAEIVDPGSGVRFAPGDAEAAAAALVGILGDEARARTLGAGARRRAAAFAAAPARERFAELAERVAGPRAAGRRRERGAAGAGLSLVTVTHDSAEALTGFLRSVERHLPAAEVIVADSGSSDGSAGVARAGGATVIELGANVGFGRASNAGVDAASEPVTILVNPDVVLLDASLAALGPLLLAEDGARRILAPRVLSPDGSLQDTAQLDPASPWMLLRALVPPAVLPPRLRRLVEPWRSPAARRVGWAVGCCLAARTETLRVLGPFDPRIFLYGEDLELGLRAADAGIETWFAPDARIVHLDAHSTSRAFGGEPFDRLATARRAALGELRGAAAADRDRRVLLLTFASRIVLKALTARVPRRELTQFGAEWRAGSAPAGLAAQNSPS